MKRNGSGEADEVEGLETSGAVAEPQPEPALVWMPGQPLGQQGSRFCATCLTALHGPCPPFPKEHDMTMFEELSALACSATLTMTVSADENGRLTVNVIFKPR